jgi:hypothetical protein
VTTLVRQRGPFDDSSLSAGAPATPTCCCCCCCLVTMATSSTIAAVNVHYLAVEHDVPEPRRRLLVTGAALTHVLWTVLVSALARSVELPAAFSVATALLPLAAWGLWLRFVYLRAGETPARAWRRALKWTVITAVLFTLEFVTLGLLLVGQVLAIPIPIVVGVRMRARRRNAAA